MNFFILQVFFWMGRFALSRITDGDHRFNLEMRRDIQLIPYIRLGGLGLIMHAVSDLDPATSQLKICCRQLNKNGGNGRIFNPNIRFFRVGTDNDSERRIFQKSRSMGLGAREFFQQIAIGNKYKLTGITHS